jgi:hypothetical protein
MESDAPAAGAVSIDDFDRILLNAPSGERRREQRTFPVAIGVDTQMLDAAATAGAKVAARGRLSRGRNFDSIDDSRATAIHIGDESLARQRERHGDGFSINAGEAFAAITEGADIEEHSSHGATIRKKGARPAVFRHFSAVHNPEKGCSALDIRAEPTQNHPAIMRFEFSVERGRKW